MSTIEFLAALATQTGLILTVLIMYINAKIDPVKQQVDFLVKYMIEHSEKIAALDERTKKH